MRRPSHPIPKEYIHEYNVLSYPLFHPPNIWQNKWLIVIKFVVNSTPLEEMARNIPFPLNADIAESL
jgi:hypothetical protein